MTERRLSRRELGRTLLARQHLLERTSAPVLELADHLVGLQAQEPRDPYLGLWSRMTAFEPAHLEQLFVDREVVRIVVMRGTIHLVTASDALVLPAHFRPVLEKELAQHSQHAPHLRDIDLAPVLRHARKYLATPRSTKQLRTELAARFPTLDAPALAYACRNHLALVQVPPRGLWTASGQVTYATAEAWLAGQEPVELTFDELVLRYLQAFGPATVADVTAWSRLTGLRPVIELLRPHLRTHRDENGRELFDVADGEITSPDVEAPVRFLPEYDNVLLSHADRSHVFDRTVGIGLYRDGPSGNGSVLVDGIVQATWRFHRPDKRAGGEGGRVVVTHQPALVARQRKAVEAEAHRALGMLSHDDPDAVVELRPAGDDAAENAGGPE